MTAGAASKSLNGLFRGEVEVLREGLVIPDS
jgi:hypothetical protein